MDGVKDCDGVDSATLSLSHSRCIYNSESNKQFYLYHPCAREKSVESNVCLGRCRARPINLSTACDYALLRLV